MEREGAEQKVYRNVRVPEDPPYLQVMYEVASKLVKYEIFIRTLTSTLAIYIYVLRGSYDAGAQAAVLGLGW